MKRKKRGKDEECFIWGRHAVLAALRSHKRPVYTVLLMEGSGGKAIEEIRREAVRRSIMIEVCPRELIESRVGKNVVHQGTVLRCGPLPARGWKEVLSHVREKKEAVVVFTDRLEDPRNLGSLIRTARAFGVETVVASKARSVPIDSHVIKASTGEAENIELLQVNNFAGVVKAFQEAGFWMIGLEASGRTPLWDLDLSMPFIGFVVGGEGSGVRKRILQMVDYTARIPMQHGVTSFNVATALGMGLYEWKRQKARRQ